MSEPKVFTQTETKSKRYYARVPGSRFCHEDGTETFFNYGFADVRILEHQNELNKILGKNPNIYIQEILPEPLPSVQQNALAEAELQAKEAALRGTKSRTSQEVGAVAPTAGNPTDPNASTVDIDLQQAVFKNAPQVVGPGAGIIKPITAATPVAPVGAAASVSK